MNTKFKFAIAFLVAGLVADTLDTLAADEVTSYSVPTGHPPISPPSGGTCPVPGVKRNAVPIRWTTPAGWKQLAPTPIRIGNFLVGGEDGKKAEVAITSFPGAVGTELDNVNRWRSEVGLPPVDLGGISSKPVTVDSLEGKIYEFSGASAKTVVVSVPRGGSTWFFKLRGDAAIADAAIPAFLDLLKTVQFNREPVAEATGHS